jgi:hypothetical protein
VAHAEERWHLEARQRTLDLGVQAGHLAQERQRVVRQRVLHLVGHREPRVAQHARLPQLRDAGAQRSLVVVALARAGQRVALAHQPRDRELGVEDALALHLGGVRGQHRRHVRVRQRRRDLRWLHAGSGQPLEAHRQRAGMAVAGALVVLASAHVVPVFGDVGEVAEVAERADHADGLVARQALEQLRQLTPRVLVALQAIGDRQLADALDQLERVGALLLADHLAEDAAEQPDVFDQRRVLRPCVVAPGGGGPAGGGPVGGGAGGHAVRSAGDAVQRRNIRASRGLRGRRRARPRGLSARAARRRGARAPPASGSRSPRRGR